MLQITPAVPKIGVDKERSTKLHQFKGPDGDSIGRSCRTNDPDDHIRQAEVGEEHEADEE